MPPYCGGILALWTSFSSPVLAMIPLVARDMGRGRGGGVVPVCSGGVHWSVGNNLRWAGVGDYRHLALFVDVNNGDGGSGGGMGAQASGWAVVRRDPGRPRDGRAAARRAGRPDKRAATRGAVPGACWACWIRPWRSRNTVTAFRTRFPEISFCVYRTSSAFPSLVTFPRDEIDPWGRQCVDCHIWGQQLPYVRGARCSHWLQFSQVHPPFDARRCAVTAPC